MAGTTTRVRRTVTRPNGRTVIRPTPIPTGERRSGPVTLFPGKIRDAPITFTAQQAQHIKLAAAVKRLSLTKADVLCLLIDKHADTVAVR